MINSSELFSHANIQIYQFFLKRLKEDNQEYADLKEIIKATHMSYPTINVTCKMLARQKILIQKRAGAYIFKPNPNSHFLEAFKTLLETLEEE